MTEPERLKMDRVAKRLDELAEQMMEIKTLLQSVIDEFNDLRQISENWRYYAEHVNGIKLPGNDDE